MEEQKQSLTNEERAAAIAEELATWDGEQWHRVGCRWVEEAPLHHSGAFWRRPKQLKHQVVKTLSDLQEEKEEVEKVHYIQLGKIMVASLPSQKGTSTIGSTIYTIPGFCFIHGRVPNGADKMDIAFYGIRKVLYTQLPPSLAHPNGQHCFESVLVTSDWWNEYSNRGKTFSTDDPQADEEL